MTSPSKGRSEREMSQSATPLTNAKILRMEQASTGTFSMSATVPMELVEANFARALERHNAALRADAERYRYLRERLHAADFEYGDPPISVLVFRWDGPISANLDQSIDAALSAAQVGER